MTSSPVFIVGVGRSGTTLLRLMLNSHPRLAIPYETHFIDAYAARLKEFGDSTDESWSERIVGALLTEEMIQKWDYVPSTEEVMSRVSEATLPAVIDALFSSYAISMNKSRWGDKSDYLDRMHIIAELFPNARFIHIVRDGRDVASSVMRLPWGPNDLLAAANWWEEHVRIGRMVGRALGRHRYTEVRYEDLVNDTQVELVRLCSFIEEEWSPAMLSYHESGQAKIPDDRLYQHKNVDKPPTASRSFAWKKEMSSVDVAVFEDYARDTLLAFGYEADGCSNISRARRNVRKLSIMIRKKTRNIMG